MLAKQFEDRVESGGKILIEPALREAAAAVPGGKTSGLATDVSVQAARRA